MGSWLNHLKQKQQQSEFKFSSHIETNKQQKIAEREKELIQLAHQLVDQIGFSNLTMDKLVAASAYSKGTIYNHFASKEDLLCVLGCYSIDFVLELMNKGLQFPGKTREKAIALNFAYQLYVQLEPALSMCVLSCKTTSVVEKASDKHLQKLQQKEQQVLALIDQVFKQGFRDGSLPVTDNTEELAALYSFSSWSLSFGSIILSRQNEQAQAIIRLDQPTFLLESFNLLLDGMQWQPLSSECDYQQCWLRIAEYFSDYTVMLNSNYVSIEDNK
ncbi:TetR/AcrR family transcriptional regulator [Catenovulum sp. 2E275]|uniref:TetR/AcrR family transcriptional regulator n=1 Tax=Catenovulum sp. 2E275 TaxID=2980497 RepID=UPI0021D0F42C|nr:TetR/AcrR family transcriptional regulator [Catenovulum sp. 2E275]MCU4675412.1 TetR/AcrR family transcriptional regulator [Catenovulum sp. 2E275]